MTPVLRAVHLLASALLLTTAHAAKPNIIFILADDMGFSDLGSYGGEIDTPNLDSLAANGLRFTQFYNTGRCWPSRAALMTGYYAQQVNRDKLPGVGGGGMRERPSWAPMLPAFLKPLGYRCYHSGKWHLDGSRQDAGFSPLDDDAEIRDSKTGNPAIDGEGIDHSQQLGRAYWSDRTSDDAIAHLRHHQKHYPHDPFFQYLAYDAPHFPLHAPEEDIDKYRDAYLDGWDKMRERRLSRLENLGIVDTDLSQLETEIGPPYPFPDAVAKLGPGEIDRPLPWDGLNEEQQRFQATKMAIHAAMVDRMDRQIGRVIAQLKAMGQFDNTLVFFASDNGASAEIMIRGRGHNPSAQPGSEDSYLCLGPGFSSASNTPFRRHKVWTHEGGIATPLIVHWPAAIKSRGELRHTPGHLIDILPTILDLLDTPKPKDWNGVPIPAAPGRSLLPAFLEDARISRNSLWWLHEENRAIRVGGWKLVSAKGEPWKLYNLRDDRAESRNLIEQHPERAQKLEDQWTEQLNSMSELVSRNNAKGLKPPPIQE